MEASDCQCKQTTSCTTESAGQNKEQDMTIRVNAGIPSCERLSSGVYNINFYFLESPKTVYCDGDTDGGGWIVITRRQDGSVDFERKWTEYKNGFGNVNGEFWIGNDLIHELTISKPMELRIDMEDIEGNKAFAKYDVFKVASEEEKYFLRVGGYSGTAGDSLDKTTYDRHSHDGMRFTTIDSDNDGSHHTNCADQFTGGWWFNACFESHLTGIYMRSPQRRYGSLGIIWMKWKRFNPLTFVEMKVR